MLYPWFWLLYPMLGSRHVWARSARTTRGIPSGSVVAACGDWPEASTAGHDAWKLCEAQCSNSNITSRNSFYRQWRFQGAALEVSKFSRDLCKSVNFVSKIMKVLLKIYYLDFKICKELLPCTFIKCLCAFGNNIYSYISYNNGRRASYKDGKAAV